MLTISAKTFGCKANQADTAALLDGLTAKLSGVPFELVPPEQAADVVLINTCTETHSADSDARQAIRRAARARPGARVVVTGCYAQTDRQALLAMPEVTAVVGNVDKALLPELLARVVRGEACLEPRRDGHRDWNPTLRDAVAIRRLPAGLDRPFVKVQDGCDYTCSFCVIPTARGPSRSRSLEDVSAEVRRYEALGAEEIVLTGIHLGHWGRDLDPRQRFGAMLEALLHQTATARFRISSLEPNEVDSHVLDLVANHPRVCRHLHVPLQSGSDTTLRRMRRVYRTPKYAEILKKFRQAVPLGAFGADVMVGFPGETDEAFEETVAFIESLDFSYLHVFPFSARRGTEAALMPDAVPPPVARERAARLLDLSTRRLSAHVARSVGTAQRVLVETGLGPGGLRQGYTEAYVGVRFAGSGHRAGRIIPVVIERSDGQWGYGTPLEPSEVEREAA